MGEKIFFPKKIFLMENFGKGRIFGPSQNSGYNFPTPNLIRELSFGKKRYGHFQFPPQNFTPPQKEDIETSLGAKKYTISL